ncbi:hypothetical protein GCM10020331_070410 [Ectobacillus funiculus]
MINLFNLMPISPLDGGRILAVVSPRVWLIGLAGLIFRSGFFWRCVSLDYYSVRHLYNLGSL